MTTRKIVYLSLLFLIVSCNSNRKSNYEYISGISRFLNEVYNTNLSSLDEKRILFVDISCEECVVSKLDFLSKDTEFYDVQLYLLGDTSNSVINERFKSLVTGYDLKSKYHLYETGISMPLLLDIDKGTISKYFFVNDFNQQEIIEYLKRSAKK